jgi:hypothetical protein
MNFLLSIALFLPAFTQAGPAPGAGPTAADQDKPPANAAGQSRDRSVLEPKPAAEAIKPKDFQDATGLWHPFTRMGDSFSKTRRPRGQVLSTPRRAMPSGGSSSGLLPGL